MKRFLLGAAAIALCATAAVAFDGDRHSTRISAASGSHIMIANGGPVIEVRGEDGERTIHIERDGEDSRITVNGQNIEVRDGAVFIDGQAIEAGDDDVVIVDGMEIRVIADGDTASFDQGFALHWAERAEHMARLQAELSELDDLHVGVDVDDIEANVMRSFELALADLEAGMHGRYINDRKWEDLTPEEQAEVREELAEAREEIREAMREVREDMREARREMAESERHHRIEMRRAQRDMERAERDVARAAREAARAEREIARVHRDLVEAHCSDMDDGEACSIREARVIRIEDHGDGNRRVWINGEEVDHDDVMIFGARSAEQRETAHLRRQVHNESIRIEEGEDGARRIWVDGEEQTGDDLVDWLNRLESERLAGAPKDRGAHDMERRVVRIDLREGERREILLDDRSRVIFVEREGDDSDTRVEPRKD